MSYFSIDREIQDKTKIKRSVFITHLFYVESMKQAKEYISKISGEHKTASHNCWAYIIGEKGEIFHSSDAGEPSGTAGRPILNVLQKHRMTNIVVVVTRYFGGVKLGIRGLINAYSECVEKAINESSLKRIIKIKHYKIITSYDFFETLKFKFKTLSVEIIDVKYSEKIILTIAIEVEQIKKMENYLIEFEKSGKIELIY